MMFSDFYKIGAFHQESLIVRVNLLIVFPPFLKGGRGDFSKGKFPRGDKRFKG
jgi:hypothetical protein